jgi:formylglycine-generating enzyme required for sulfatase activity
VDVSALSALEKAKAWELAELACVPAGYRVFQIRSRIAHWKESASRGDYTEDGGVGLGLPMVWVKPDSFRMGSPDSEAGRGDDEGPVHDVELDGFWLGKTEITVGQFRQFVNSTGWKTDAEKSGKSYGFDSSGSWGEQSGLSWRNAGFAQGDDHPVVHVSWTDAKGFCDWLSGKTVAPGRSYRLPTEAQWEYACRAGGATPFSFGETISTDQANYDGNYTYGNGAKGVYRKKTTPVGSFSAFANAFGFYDMHGNVWEWCSDRYDGKFYGTSAARSRNPENTVEGSGRVGRGGGWFYDPQYCRSAYRSGLTPGISGVNLGFRVLAVPAASK